MKNFILLLVFILNSVLLFGQSEKTFIKSFVLESSDVIIDVEGETTISSWDGDYVKIEMIIYANIGIEMLNSLTKAGRYDISNNFENGVHIFSLQKIKKKIKINEKEIIESVKFKIWLPNKVRVKKSNSL